MQQGLQLVSPACYKRRSTAIVPHFSLEAAQQGDARPDHDDPGRRADDERTGGEASPALREHQQRRPDGDQDERPQRPEEAQASPAVTKNRITASTWSPHPVATPAPTPGPCFAVGACGNRRVCQFGRAHPAAVIGAADSGRRPTRRAGRRPGRAGHSGILSVRTGRAAHRGSAGVRGSAPLLGPPGSTSGSSGAGLSGDGSSGGLSTRPPSFRGCD